MAEKTQEESQIKYRINPTHYMTYDGEGKTWELEIQLPGISKENIKFKVLPDAYFLEAKRDAALYNLSEYFPFEVDPSTVTGKYENGLLIIGGKLKDPLAEAVEIKVA